MQVSPSFTGTGVFSLGSRFKFSGHTQKQALQQVQNHHRQPPQVRVVKRWKIKCFKYVCNLNIYAYVCICNTLFSLLFYQFTRRPSKRYLRRKNDKTLDGNEDEAVQGKFYNFNFSTIQRMQTNIKYQHRRKAIFTNISHN